MLNGIIPYHSWTDFTPTLPQFYWDVYSAEQRIKHICYELCKIYRYSDYLAGQLETLGNQVENEIVQIRADLNHKIDALRAELMDLIEALETGQLQWDVQLGKYTATVEAQRDMFNDVTVHSYNLEQLDVIFNTKNFTVEDLANCGLNVKGYAVYNHYIQTPTALTDDLLY